MIQITRRATLQALAAATVAARAGATTRSGADMLLVDATLTPGELRVPLRRALLVTTRQSIEADLVVQWRKSLQRQIENHAGGVIALVRWDKALVLTGLAREHRWRTRSQRVSPSVFRIELSKV
jgi:hypothetical protein